MSQISLAGVASALDTLLDEQMTGQARIAAHLVAAAEGAGRTPDGIIGIFDSVANQTVLDELWITDEKGFAYLTNVRNPDGTLVEFTFSPDEEVQPQASAFFPLLSASTDSNAVIAQKAQTREIDWEIYKYVGVSGVDRKRIVQVGNALAFEEQGLLAHSYASPVMTAVLAAFGEAELLAARFTSRVAEIRSVFDAILTRQMAVQAGLIDAFVGVAEAAGWPVVKINTHLRRIAETTPIGEVQVATTGGQIVLTSSAVPGALRFPDSLAAINQSSMDTVEHPTMVHDEHKPAEKTVTVYSPNLARIVQISTLLDDSSLVSPRFALPGD